MSGDEGPYIELNGPRVWVPRTVPYRMARGVAATVSVESWQRLRYIGKADADLLGFARDCQCEEVCELRWRDDEDTGDRTCHVPAWEFEVIEP